MAAAIPAITAIGTLAGGGAAIAGATKKPPNQQQMPPAQDLMGQLQRISSQAPQIQAPALPQPQQQNLLQLLQMGGQ